LCKPHAVLLNGIEVKKRKERGGRDECRKSKRYSLWRRYHILEENINMPGQLQHGITRGL
jgi:hypothetical protein